MSNTIYIVAHPSFWDALPTDRFLSCGRVKRIAPEDINAAPGQECAKLFGTKEEAVKCGVATNCHVLSFSVRSAEVIDIQLLLDFAKK